MQLLGWPVATFVDFLFSCLTIPMRQIECLLDSKSCLENIDNLHKSVIKFIDEKYLTAPETKDKLIKPKLPPGYLSTKQIIPLIEDSMSPSYYMRGGVACVYPKVEGSYVKGPKMFMVTDDLTVTPFSIASALSVLKVLKICLSDVEEVEVNIGLEEVLVLFEFYV
ncbi:hypothetical protein OROMI_019775 [Orobanche minor]